MSTSSTIVSDNMAAEDMRGLVIQCIDVPSIPSLRINGNKYQEPNDAEEGIRCKRECMSHSGAADQSGVGRLVFVGTRLLPISDDVLNKKPTDYQPSLRNFNPVAHRIYSRAVQLKRMVLIRM